MFLGKRSRTELPSASRKELILLVKAASCGFNSTRSHGRLLLTCNHQVVPRSLSCLRAFLFFNGWYFTSVKGPVCTF